VCSLGSYLYVVYAHEAGHEIFVYRTELNLPYNTNYGFQTVSASTDAVNLSIGLDPTNTYLLVAYHADGGEAYARRLLESNLTLGSTLALSTGAAAYGPLLVAPGLVSNEMLVYHTHIEDISGTDFDFYVQKTSWTSLNVATQTVTGTGTVNGARVASRAFNSSGESHWLWMHLGRDQSYQRQYLLARHDSSGIQVAGRVALGSAALFSDDVLPHITPGGETTVLEAYAASGELSDAESLTFGAKSLRVSWGDDRMTSDTLGGLCFSGALPLQWDGRSLAELGFLVYPDQLTYAVGGASGVGAGTYRYVARYKATDALGNVHRSAPSVAMSVTLASADDVTVKVEKCPFSWRDGIAVEVYRTTDDGTLFYFVGEVSNELVPLADHATVVDTLSDSELVERAVLDTSAGELEEFSPPGANSITIHNGRLWLGAGTRVYYSKEYISGYGPGFVDDRFVEVDEPVTALSSSGDALVAFAENAVYLVWGEGPDRLGGGSAFNTPRSMSGNCGCPVALGGQRSICRIDAGILFRSAKGIALLPAEGGTPQIVSDPVEDQLEQYDVITSALLLEEERRVKFTAVSSTTGESRIFVWDLESLVWTTETFPGDGAARAAVVFDGNYAFANDSAVFVGWKESYDDLGESSYPIEYRIKTRKLYPAGRDGEARVYSTTVDGEAAAADTLTIVTGINDTDPSSDPEDPLRRDVAVDGVFAVSYENPRQRCNNIQYELSGDVEDGVLSFAGITLHTATLQARRRHTVRC